MRNLNDLWTDSAARFAGRTAVIFEDEAHSYARIDSGIRAFAAGLRARFGVRPGDRVALLMPNCLHSILCYWGAIRAGAVAVPINVRLKPEEVQFILQDAAPAVAVAHVSIYPWAREALARLAARIPVIGIGFEEKGVTPVAAVLATPDSTDPAPAGPEDVAAIIYTSGTTGRPKGAMITHGNVLFNIAATKAGHGFRPDDVHLLVVPLFHVTGLNTIMPTAFSQGAALVVAARAAPSDILPLIERHRATTFFAVPTTMILLAQARGIERHDLSSLRLVAYSGAPMPVRAIQRLRELLPSVRLHNFFGLTETTSVTTVLPDEQALARPESVGRAVPGLELKVVDDAGSALPPGQVGELLVKGPSVVKGYYNRPKATAEAIVGGWLRTGDTAFIDAEGYVFLQGRTKEMILVAGENVYPVEVENVLSRHPAVAEAAAIGVPHPVLGEVVKAVVVLHPGAEADALALKRWCAARLASYKVPQSIEFRDALPRNPSGKVVKRELSESVREGAETQRGERGGAEELRGR
ncbi:MAG: long-chain-fatty-acid--CoA ligase [Armatimonadetes bacterium]|nr:long-chain-fatty-acid--CoA ligase [Armatimonadota bacterium]